MRARVLEVIRPAPGYALIRAEPESPAPASAGQFAMLRAPGSFLGRPMSILDSGRTIRFLVRAVGEGSRALALLDPGSVLEMIAPLGSPFPPPASGDVLVAGGVGAAPILFQARTGPGSTVIYGGRTASDLVLLEEMGRSSRLVLATEDGSAGTKGLATDPLAAMLDRGEARRVLACGPLAMMAAAARLAREASIPCLVCLEALMACGFGACLGCAVPAAAGGFLHACTDGPVVPADRVDWDRLPDTT